MSKKAYQVLQGDGPPCPRCEQPTEIRVHTAITDKELSRPFYYSRWYRCNNEFCRTTLIMPKEFIVWKEPETNGENKVPDLFEMVGMRHRGTAQYVAGLPNGAELTLEREPDNSYDGNAVKVLHKGRHVAYIKAVQAVSLAMAMDAKDIKSIVGRFSLEDGWPSVETSAV